jgi:cobalt/nickel transport protein
MTHSGNQLSHLRGPLTVLILLTVLTPVFGVAADAVGYTEPLEIAAETTGAIDDANPVTIAPFPDYTVPGLGGVTGTVLSALLGIGLTLGVMIVVGRLLGTDTDGVGEHDPN